MIRKATFAHFAVVVFLFVGLFFSVVPFLSKSTLAYFTNMSADVVVGQSDFTSNTGGATQGHFGSTNTLRGILIDAMGRMIVSDQLNSRVLIWNKVPTTNGVPADLVLGQSDFTSSTANNGGRTASSMSSPSGVYSDGTRLFVADGGNNRVLVWNTLPTTMRQAADIVIGQSDMTSNTTTCDASHLVSTPQGIALYNGKLIISAGTNSATPNRVLIYNSIPTSNGASANVVLGQQDMITCGTNSTAANTLSRPQSVTVDTNGRLYVGDLLNKRVLVWNSIPTTNFASADVVIGQANFTANGATTTSSGFNNPSGVYIYNNRLFVADTSNSRVLIFNNLPTSNGASADVVLGQSDFISGLPNAGGSTAATSLSAPLSVHVYNNQLFVGDQNNNRVVIYNNILSGPQLGLGNPELLSDGRMKVTGSVNLGNRGTYSLHDVKVSVNGSGFAQATNIGSGTDAGNGATNYVFSHEFEPWAENNGTRENWINDNSGMSVSKGYTLIVRATSLNAEEDTAFLFTPFKLNSVSSGILPTFSITVNTAQWNRLKDNLASYEVHVKKTAEKDKKGKIIAPEGQWTTYLDNIPLDTTASQNPTLATTYNQTTGVITVQPKTRTLPAGTYTVQIIAKDRWGHTTNQTNELSYTSTGVSIASNKPNLPATREWFPLQVNRVTGFKTGIISNFNASISPSYFSTTPSPTFEGIAFNNSTVYIQVTDTKTGKSKQYQTTTQSSVWKLTLKLYTSSLVDVWVTDGNGRYNELPSLAVTVSTQN